MSIVKSIVWTIGIFGIVLFAVACGDDDDDEESCGPARLERGRLRRRVRRWRALPAAPVTNAQRAAGGAGTAGTATQAAAPQYATASAEAGIWVTGTGEMNLRA